MLVQLLEAGKKVVATCRSTQKAEALQSLASSHQGRLVILSLDVNDEDSVQVMHCPKRAHQQGSVLVFTTNQCIKPTHEPSFTTMWHEYLLHAGSGRRGGETFPCWDRSPHQQCWHPF